MTTNIIIKPNFSTDQQRLTYQSSQQRTYCTGGRIVELNPGDYLDLSLMRDDLTDGQNINLVVDDLLKRRAHAKETIQ